MQRKPDKFNEKLNMDTANTEEISSTSSDLVDYMRIKNEDIAADHVEYLISNQTSTKTAKSTPTDPNYTKLLKVNSSILEVLKRIQEDMIDEQDTSIKKSKKVGDVNNIFYNNYFGEDAEDSYGSSGFNFGGSGMPGFGLGRRGSGAAPGRKTSKMKPPKDPKKLKKVSRFRKMGKLGKIAKNTLKIGRVFGKLLLPLTIGLSVYDAVEGWNNAGEVFNIPEDELTTGQKLSSAAGGIISGLSFGYIDPAEAAKNVLNGFSVPTEESRDYTRKIEKRDLNDFEKGTLEESQNKIIEINEKIIDAEKTIQEHSKIIDTSTDPETIKKSKDLVKGLEVVKTSLQKYVNNEIKNIQLLREIDSSTNSDLYKTYNNYVSNVQKIHNDTSIVPEPVKVSEQNKQNTNVNNKYNENNYSVETNKNIKEQIIDQTSRNLTKQTVIFNSSIAAKQAQSIIEPLINSTTINQSSNKNEERHLNLFSE